MDLSNFWWASGAGGDTPEAPDPGTSVGQSLQTRGDQRL